MRISRNRNPNVITSLSFLYNTTDSFICMRERYRVKVSSKYTHTHKAPHHPPHSLESNNRSLGKILKVVKENNHGELNTAERLYFSIKTSHVYFH